MRVVTEAMSMRGMTIGSDPGGGFALPFSLDPSIMLTSNGALNPIRQVARVFTVATDKWKGVSSAGVTTSAGTPSTSSNSPTMSSRCSSGTVHGGELVRKLYGHPDARIARERVREAFRQAPTAPARSARSTSSARGPLRVAHDDVPCCRGADLPEERHV